MHLHRKQWDIWHFVEGQAFVRLYYHETGDDQRYVMGPGMVLAIPPGVSHGFYTEDGCILMYALTEEYDGSDEYGWHFADGLTDEYGVTWAQGWPTDPTGLRISERDLRASRLVEFGA